MTLNQTENLFSRMKARRQYLLKRLMVTFSVAVVFLGFFELETFKGFDKNILDLEMSFSSSKQTSGPTSVILSISQKTLDQMGAWPWPNRYHARTLEILKRLGVRAVYFDYSFSQATSDEDDALLAEAIKRSEIPVYFAADIGKKEIGIGQGLGVLESETNALDAWRRPLAKFEAIASGVGHRAIQPDSDGVFRFWRPEIKLQNQLFKDISWKIFSDFQFHVANSFQPHLTELIPWNRTAYETIPHVEYVDLLNSFLAEQNGMKPTVPPEIFQDRICWIGLTANNQTVIGDTPWHQKIAAVEVLAAIFQGLMADHPKQTLSRAANFIFILSVIFVTLLLTGFCEGKKFWIGAGICMVSVLIAAPITFFTFDYWLSVATAVLFLFFAFIATLIFDSVAGSKERSNLFHLATRDGLTNLYVIRHFRVIMNQVTREARARKEMLTIILLDIDHFKKINDSFGHPAGDRVLKKTAEVVQAAVRQKRAFKDVDFVARYGGEEFIILVRRCSLENTAKLIAERIREAVEKTNYEWQGQKIAVTTSLGVAALAENENIPDAMVHRADKALYLAKQTGRNRVCTELDS